MTSLRLRRSLAGLAATVLAATGLMVADAATRPALAAPCSGTSGVTVVVDFTALGGEIEIACAPGDPASGLAALSGAGFSYSFVPRFPGLVCRIDTLPDPCNGAPVNAYWSYWHAPSGGSWTYSSVGAGSFNPAPGTAQGWAFGAGDPPGTNPP